jgi:hypothetical protein
MEVLNAAQISDFSSSENLTENLTPNPASGAASVEPFPRTLEGERLVQTVVSLTDLPEPLIRDEMTQLLEATGHSSQDLTIEQLRASMLAYLEALHESIQE